MTIIEYILDPQDKPRSFYPKTIPDYVVDGGYFLHSDGSGKMIGIGKGSIPDSVTTLTLEELQERQRAIHSEYPMVKGPDTFEEMTDDEVNDVVEEWVDARS